VGDKFHRGLLPAQTPTNFTRISIYRAPWPKTLKEQILSCATTAQLLNGDNPAPPTLELAVAFLAGTESLLPAWLGTIVMQGVQGLESQYQLSASSSLPSALPWLLGITMNLNPQANHGANHSFPEHKDGCANNRQTGEKRGLLPFPRNLLAHHHRALPGSQPGRKGGRRSLSPKPEGRQPGPEAGTVQSRVKTQWE
jgi:hypothetical protein